MSKKINNPALKMHERLVNDSPFATLVFEPIFHQDIEDYIFELSFFNQVANDLFDLKAFKKNAVHLNLIIPAPATTDVFKACKETLKSGRSTDLLLRLDKNDQPDNYKIHIKKIDAWIVLFLCRQDSLELEELTSIKDEIKYQKLFEKSLDAIFLADEQFNIISVNPKFCDIFKFSESEVAPLLLKDLFKDGEQFYELKAMLKKRKFIEEIEADLIASDGDLRHCFINAVPVFDDFDNLMMYQGVIRDITKRKETEQKLITAEKLTVTGKLARSIAHEVRNPLTNIRLALDQFKEELPEDDEDAAFYFSLISRNVDRISNLITDLMNSSKQKALSLRRHQLNDILVETINLIRDRLKLKNIDLKTDFCQDLPLLLLDKKQVEIAFINILLNAIEALDAGKGLINIKSYIKGECACVDITDNGRGIPKDELDNLFEPFYTGKKSGSGLGLTTTRNIIHGHNGTIAVESEVGKGTTITITFFIELDTDKIDMKHMV